ncbi:fatty acyl-AMP ligase [Limnohabitans sp. 2KL-1]|jgi:hypothetical protein|uniref:fatty acyl-AMP ligase n=1 Tax=Limnohabitans sp. 2KL-1 TaxID=1100699 RepID=UPI0011B299A0|nr:fatty acyl-AMP ligase [Limnohabitans sp. 2KL-1]
MLHSSNDLTNPILGLCEWANLPTMKSQLSQLPLIVGSGRVASDAPFFLFRIVDPQTLAELP